VKIPLLRWLPDAVARAPASIHHKLSAAFLAIVGLLFVVGAVSVSELGLVTRQTEDLVKLQRKIAAYRQIQHDTTLQLYGVASALLVPNERTLESTLRQLGQFGYDLDRLQFVAKDEAEILSRVRADYESFTAVVGEIIELIRKGKTAEAGELQTGKAGPLADRLERLTNELVNKAEADMVAGIDEPRALRDLAPPRHRLRNREHASCARPWLRHFLVAHRPGPGHGRTLQRARGGRFQQAR
jgi:CHASE3 domain sensor protein